MLSLSLSKDNFFTTEKQVEYAIGQKYKPFSVCVGRTPWPSEYPLLFPKTEPTASQAHEGAAMDTMSKSACGCMASNWSRMVLAWALDTISTRSGLA